MAQVCCISHLKLDQDCGKWLHKRPNFTRLPLLYHRVKGSENSFWASYGFMFYATLNVLPLIQQAFFIHALSSLSQSN